MKVGVGLPFLFALLALSLLASCASPPSDIPAQYVSSANFKTQSCQALHEEADKAAVRASDLRYVLKDKANKDAAQLGIGMLFLPTLLFLEGGDGLEAKEYSRLRGTLLAIGDVANEKGCPLEQRALDVVAGQTTCAPDQRTSAGKCPPSLIRRIPPLAN